MRRSHNKTLTIIAIDAHLAAVQVAHQLAVGGQRSTVQSAPQCVLELFGLFAFGSLWFAFAFLKWTRIPFDSPFLQRILMTNSPEWYPFSWSAAGGHCEVWNRDHRHCRLALRRDCGATGTCRWCGSWSTLVRLASEHSERSEMARGVVSYFEMALGALAFRVEQRFLCGWMATRGVYGLVGRVSGRYFFRVGLLLGWLGLGLRYR